MKKVEESKATSLSVEPRKPRRKFDPAFKRDAVAMWLGSGKSAREIGAELGITERHLHSWHKKHAPPTATQRSQMESEVVALRRENALLRQQRDILKKTLGILSEPPSSATNGSTS
jgi:transposase